MILKRPQLIIILLYFILYASLNMHMYHIDFTSAIKGVVFVLLLCVLGGKILFKLVPEDLGIFALLTAGFVLSMSMISFVSFTMFHFVQYGLSYETIFYNSMFFLILLSLLIHRKESKEYILFLLRKEKNEYLFTIVFLLFYSFVYAVVYYYGKANVLSNLEFGINIGDWANQTDLYAHFSRNIDPILMGLPLAKLKHMFNHFTGLGFSFWSFDKLTLATSIVAFKMLLPFFIFTILVWLNLFYKFTFEINNAFVWTLLTPLFAPITFNIISYNPFNSRFGFLSWTSLYHSDTQLLVVAPILIALFFLFRSLKKDDASSFTLFSVFLFISFFIKPSGYTVIFPSVLLILLVFRKFYSKGYVLGGIILMIPPIYWKLYSSSMGIITNANMIKFKFSFLETKIKSLQKLYEYGELSLYISVLIIFLSSFLFVIPVFVHLLKRKSIDIDSVNLFIIVLTIVGVVPAVLFNSNNSNIGWLSVISIMVILPAIIRYAQLQFERTWKYVFYFIMFLHCYSGFKFGWYFVKFC
ncbi:MAG: hypothetical protein KKI15_05520 [Proteobacteria bacterium]|nr:hypothetical protein [Pseudomonadota bacterium]